MKRYFKHASDSDLGEGLAYLEITEGWPTRQVEVSGERWRWGDDANNEWLADQPFEVLGLGDDHEIQPDEFELVWQEALRRRPPSREGNSGRGYRHR